MSSSGPALLICLIATWCAPDDGDRIRREAQTSLVQQLEQLVSWCDTSHLFLERDHLSQLILHFDPDNAAARKALKYKRSKSGEWQQEAAYKEPRNFDDKKLTELHSRRAAVLSPFRESILKLAETETSAGPESRRDALIQDLLACDPDDARAHELLGEVKLDDRWVLAETANAKRRRAEIRTLVKSCLEQAPEPKEATPSAAETALGLKWTFVLATPCVRVLGTGELTEIARAARVTHAAGDLFRALFATDTKHWKGLTHFVLAHRDERVTLIEKHPGVSAEQKAILMQLDSTGFPEAQFAEWGPDEAKRLDSAVRATLSAFFQSAFDVTTRQGWAFEGFGLYLTRELIGTRLTWFVQPSAALRRVDLELRARLLSSESNWMEEANKLFDKGLMPKIADLLKKDVNTMDEADMVLSYALATFLLEGHSQQTTALLAKVPQEGGEPAIREVLGLSLPQLEARLQRFLKERR